MPTSWRALRALLIAAAFSPEQLAKVCQTAFGCDLAAITSAQDAAQQADAIIAYAVRYDLLRELADVVLSASADRPAVQNLLLSDDMQDSGASSAAPFQQRIESRLDRIIETQAQQGAILAELQRWASATVARVRALEAHGNNAGTITINWNIIMFGLVLSLLAALAIFVSSRI